MRAGHVPKTKFSQKELGSYWKETAPMPVKAYKGVLYSRLLNTQLFKIHDRKKGCPGWKKAWATQFSKEREVMRFIDQTILPSLDEEVVKKIQEENKTETCSSCHYTYYPAYDYHGRCPICTS